MAYSIENGIWHSVFAVPCEIVDKHLKLCGELPLKVLLCILRHGRCPEPGELARALGGKVSEADAQDAVDYWVRQGVLHGAEDSAAFTAQTEASAQAGLPPEPEAPQPPAGTSAPPAAPAADPYAPPQAGNLRKLSAARPRMLTHDINEMARKDENIRYLLQEAQVAIGRELTPVATEIVVALYSYYGMTPDMILMLMHYCVSMGKSSPRYMEKVAADWLDKGIDTHEKAEQEIRRVCERGKTENKIISALGIRDRALITSEKAFIQRWTEEWQLDVPLIVLAYERTIEQKGKLSFPYMNGILSSWVKAGIRTPEQAMREERPTKPEAKSGAASSYDMGELEEMITYGSIR